MSMTIQALLKAAELPDSPSARLDAELLLAAALDKPRTYLHIWPERQVEEPRVARFLQLIERRRRGEPVAYLLGRQGFWSLDLDVAPHTLIPRADTEVLVETALELISADTAEVLDLGTGTGAIALAVASERPQWQVLGVDRIAEAVALAEGNGRRLRITNANFLVSDWFSSLADRRFHLILGNPPYVPSGDRHLTEGDVRFEPTSALVAGPDGLDDLRRIVEQAPAFLCPGGWLALEHGYDQGAAVRGLMQARGFLNIASRRDLGGNERVTLGHLP